MDIIAAALGSTSALVWGDRAVAFLGVRTAVEASRNGFPRRLLVLISLAFFLVVDDTKLQYAAQQLRSAGFRDCSWSCGSLKPGFYTGTINERVYCIIVNEYGNLDQHPTRFLFPASIREPSSTKVILLPTPYAHILVEHPSNEALDDDSQIYYPDAPRLLQSFVQTLLLEPVQGMLTSALTVWAVSYLYGELMLDDSVLDECGDQEAIDWFNEKILRFSGGMDRVTCTKRLGRVG